MSESETYHSNYLIELPDSVSIGFVKEIINKFHQDSQNIEAESEESEEEQDFEPKEFEQNEEDDGECKEQEPLFVLSGSCFEISNKIPIKKSVAVFMHIANSIYAEKGITEPKMKEICSWVRSLINI